MQAGKLRKRVEVQELRGPSADPAQQDPYGAPPSPAKDGNWRPLVERWAGVKSLSGRELFLAQQVVANVTHEVSMRWFKDARTYSLEPGVKPKHRLLLQGRRKLNVRSCVNVDERNRELLLYCIEEV